MKPTSREVSHLIDTIDDQASDDGIVQLLNTTANSMQAAQSLVDGLISRRLGLNDSPIAAVNYTMDTLERIAERAELAACIFMAHLWPVSSALQLHDICNSIDLWITHCALPELKEHLLQLASTQECDNVAKHFEQLAIANRGPRP